MKMSSTQQIYVLGLLLLLSACNGQKKETSKEQEAEVATETFQPNWKSLGKHQESPEWFKDAKLGIYFHWGVYSVPAFDNEWYPRHMHLKGHKVYDHHLENYGHPSEFGYHDFVPMFKAEKFNAEEWAELFKKAGARFAGPVAEHHDGFAMWDSEVTPWNVMDKGPKRDITGELKEAFDSRDIKLIATFHHSKQLQRSNELNKEAPLSHYPYLEGMPTSSEDLELALLYGNIPEEKWLKEVWLGKLEEVIDKYQPDIIWFDYILDAIPEEFREEFAAYYLNKAEEWGKEVVIVRKQHDLPLSMSVEDLEQSRKNVIGTKTWMTDATVSNGSWCYTENLKVKQPQDVLHMLIDIVSKNGVLLLNVSPKADGSIPDNQKQVLLEMGEWLSEFGEAIYGTEAWYTFGEGPTKEPTGHFENNAAFHKLKYTAEDIRYTTKDYDIYAIVQGTPDKGKDLLLKAFAKKHILDPVRIEDVSILGESSPITWEVTEEGLKISVPENIKDRMATVIKVKTSA